jgi:internalin A
MFILFISFIIAFPSTLPIHTAYAAGKSNGELHAFYPSNAVFSEQMQSYIDSVDSVSFAWSRIDAETPESLNTVKEKNGNNGFYYPEDYLQPVKYAKSMGKSIQLNIYMDGSDGATLLPYDDKQSVMIQTIIDCMQTDITQGEGIYFDGVVIDFEGLCNNDGNGSSILYDGKQISTYFVEFLTQLKEQLNSIGKKLYVAVNPGIYYDGYDYAGILNIADRVIVMAHDYEPSKRERLTKSQVEQYSGYDALQPVNSPAPAQLVRQALNEMQSAADDSSELSKVWLQIAFDSAQWQFDASSAEDFEELSGTTLCREKRLTPLYKSIKARVDNSDGYGQNITYGYNNELQCPYIHYYNSNDKSWNMIVYEDSNSISAKIDLAKAYGLGGISVWSLANMPDYNDTMGKKYHLDGWSTIISKMNAYGTKPAGNSRYVSFTDKAVEQSVRLKLGKPSGKITVSDTQSIYRLKLSEGVKSLKDLKKLTNLEYLYAGQLKLKDISSLGNLTKLRVLYLQRNNISDISALKKLKKLEVLSLNGNKVSDLKPISGLTSLNKLYLKENKIKSVTSLKGLIHLSELYLEGNLISEYSSVKKIYPQLECDFVIN